MAFDNTVATLESGDYRVCMVYDSDPVNPRSEWEHGGVMWAEHSRYTLGDQGGYAAQLDDFIREMEEFHYGPALVTAIIKHLHRRFKSTVILPLYLLDHSGISISAGANLLDGGGINTRTHFTADLGGWDTSFVGFAFNVGLPEHVEKWGEVDEEQLRAEVREYDDYLTGQVFGLITERRVIRKSETFTLDGELLDSSEDDDAWSEVDACWGYLGRDYAESEARAQLEHYTKKEAA